MNIFNVWGGGNKQTGLKHMTTWPQKPCVIGGMNKSVGVCLNIEPVPVILRHRKHLCGYTSCSLCCPRTTQKQNRFLYLYCFSLYDSKSQRLIRKNWITCNLAAIKALLYLLASLFLSLCIFTEKIVNFRHNGKKNNSVQFVYKSQRFIQMNWITCKLETCNNAPSHADTGWPT